MKRLPFRWILGITLLLGFCAVGSARAQAKDGMLSEAEVESLRDSSYVPVDRIRAYQKILETRESRINTLLNAKRKHVTFGEDMHDAMEQFGEITDELNDNLSDLEKQHRDLRKVLPKLILMTERWSTVLRAPADDAAYKIVRKVAVDALKETKDMATEMLADEEAYFKAHPDAAKAEKERFENPHGPTKGEGPR